VAKPGTPLPHVEPETKELQSKAWQNIWNDELRGKIPETRELGAVQFKLYFFWLT